MTTIETANKCSDCRHWQNVGGGLGNCKRRAPVLGSPERVLSARWPTTSTYDSCSEYEEKPGAAVALPQAICGQRIPVSDGMKATARNEALRLSAYNREAQGRGIAQDSYHLEGSDPVTIYLAMEEKRKEESHGKRIILAWDMGQGRLVEVC